MAVRFALALLGVLLLVPAGAQAAVTFGAPAALAPDGSAARTGSFAFLGSPTAPADGVLVRWTLRTDSTPSMTPAIFRAGTLVAQDPTPMTAADRTVSLPIQVGDQLGLRAPGGTLPQAFDGATLLVTGVIEPDADHDDYGDETQDACPAEASLHVAPCHADIAVTMTGPAFGVVDRDTSYEVAVANRGPSAAAGETVTDVIPSGARFVRTEGPATCTPGATLRCTLAPIASGTSGVLTIVLAGTAEGASFHHAVSVTTTSADPTPGDHSASVDTLVTGASIAPPPLTLGGAPCANRSFGGRDDDVLFGSS
ncbi:MAG: DUF11 domain-containing protein, partial [Solirubrobacteraceae bacterium]